MRVRVSFRVDTTTGQVQTFLIEDVGAESGPEHEALHDQIAYEVGKVVERRPAPQQVIGGAAAGEGGPLVYRPDETSVPTEEEPTGERRTTSE
jgi:hypothetical protein